MTRRSFLSRLVALGAAACSALTLRRDPPTSAPRTAPEPAHVEEVPSYRHNVYDMTIGGEPVTIEEYTKFAPAYQWHVMKGTGIVFRGVQG